MASAAVEAAKGIFREFTAGLRMFVRNRYLVVLLSMAVICQLGTGAINALDVFFVTANLHSSAHLLGFISMAFGVGAIAGSLPAARVVARIGPRTTTWLTLLAGGFAFFALPRAGADQADQADEPDQVELTDPTPA